MKTKPLLGLALVPVAMAVLAPPPAPQSAAEPAPLKPTTVLYTETPQTVVPQRWPTEPRVAAAAISEATIPERPSWPDDWPSLDPFPAEVAAPAAGAASATQTMGSGEIDVELPSSSELPTDEEPVGGEEKTPGPPDFFEEGRPVPHVPGEPPFGSVHITRGRYQSMYAPPERVPDLERLEPEPPREDGERERAAVPPGEDPAPDPVGETPPPEEKPGIHIAGTSASRPGPDLGEVFDEPVHLTEGEHASTRIDWGEDDEGDETVDEGETDDADETDEVDELLDRLNKRLAEEVELLAALVAADRKKLPKWLQDAIRDRASMRVIPVEDPDVSEDPAPDPVGETPPPEEKPGEDGEARVVNPVVDPTALGGPSGRGGATIPIEAVFLALGGSTGGVIAGYFASFLGEAVRLQTEGLVLKPVDELDPASQMRLDQIVGSGSSGKPLPPPSTGGGGAGPAPLPPEWQGANVVRVVLDAYCLQFAAGVPTVGTVFRIAERAMQAENALFRSIIAVSRRLREAGALHPDTQPDSYFHSIRQWAIWVEERGLDREQFEEAFVEHARKNFEAAGREWTDEVERLVRQIAPNRWNDLKVILDEARRSARAA